MYAVSRHQSKMSVNLCNCGPFFGEFFWGKQPCHILSALSVKSDKSNAQADCVAY